MFEQAVEAARAHAIETWPKEACGIVAGGQYVRIRNTARDPHNAFRMPARTFADHQVEAVIHSHTQAHGPWPSASDMQGQIDTAVPWGILWCDGETARGPVWFGDHVLDEPLLGRPFRPGITDCYSLVRAWFRQERGIALKEFPRDELWWKDGGDMLAEGFGPAGFAPVDNMKAGDVLLMTIRSQVANHCAVVLENGLMLHHLENRLSAREVIGRYKPFITQVVRHGG